MKCDVIRDLIPLYTDGCCSEESAALVTAHVQGCEDCRRHLEQAQTPLPQAEDPAKPQKIGKISLWKASILQSVLFLVYFAIVAAGVAREAATGNDGPNGFWAFFVVIPATGFLLSLVNWYFVRLYRSRRAFVVWSVIAAAAATLACALWCLWHYEVPLRFTYLWWLLRLGLYASGIGLFPAVNFLLAGVLSNLYARMIGKE